MYRFVAVLAAVGILSSQDAREIVRRSVAEAEQNERVARNYTFLQRTNSVQLDGRGREKERKITTYDVTLLAGSPYRRLVARDDKPLSAKEQEKEEEKLRKITAERQKETPDQRAHRLADYDKRRQQEREMRQEFPDAFNFHLTGTENLDGRGMYVIEATPRRGFQARTRTGRYFTKLQGKVWIDRQDYSWAKVEAEIIDTISFGAFLVRLGKGSHVEIEQTRVNNEVWLPKRIHLAASARLALVKKFQGEADITYSNYRKFQADSHVVAVEAIP